MDGLTNSDLILEIERLSQYENNTLAECIIIIFKAELNKRKRAREGVDKKELREIMVEHGFVPDDKLLEFGEIVVRECIASLRQEASIKSVQLMENSEMFAMGLVAAAGVLKQRFGVEDGSTRK